LREEVAGCDNNWERTAAIAVNHQVRIEKERILVGNEQQDNQVKGKMPTAVKKNTQEERCRQLS
jgi:hypothetical protein